MRDLRYAIRVLLKAPAFTIPATLTLALCIGANAAIYTVVDRVLLRALPYSHPDRLALVVREYRGNGISEDDAGQAGATWEALKEGASPHSIATFDPRPSATFRSTNQVAELKVAGIPRTVSDPNQVANTVAVTI